MKLTDERIIEYLKKKHGENFDIDSFLNVDYSGLRDAKKFNDIEKITEKINAAVLSGKKILVYGDYDSDGVCASAILYLYFKSRGANVSVFIPNRFENGYGISVDAIEEIVSDYSPELIITVDLGITAVEEVEILKQEGIDIIVTDHHLPLAEVPNCLILDPKYKNEEYGFDQLCGAGVAMKLVEALSGREEANKYIDFAGVATIGDIVPLINENRVISKIAVDKINKGDCHKSLSFLKDKLGLNKISSTDISFKIVPRFNACGRMDSAFKVLSFLVEDDPKLLDKKFAEIESDNNLRLACIDKGNKEIEKSMRDFNFNDPAIFVVGDFHEGVIGILASRICHEYHKPTIVFTKTESGTLKGSGRSIDEIDLHKIIAGMTDMLENFGGHKMAVGLEIEPSVFEIFKSKVNHKIREIVSDDVFLVDNKSYDIEISEDDITDYFYNQLELLEPFGCENEKPVLALRQTSLSVQPISEKAFKHYKCFTPKNHSFICFGFYDYVPVLSSSSEKLIKLELSQNIFNGKTQIQAQAKDLAITNAVIGENKDTLLAALYNKYYSIFDFNNKDNYILEENLEKVILENFSASNFGSLVVATTPSDIEVIKKLKLEKYIVAKPFKNNQNAVLTSSRGVYSLESASGYKNIIFLSKIFDEEHLYFSQKHRVFEPKEKLSVQTNLSQDRTVFVKVYKLIKENSGLKANDELDLAKKLAIKDGALSSEQILYAMIVFMELNFIEWDSVLNQMTILDAKKVELDKSKFYAEVSNYAKV